MILRGDDMFLKATVYSNSKRGYFPVASIDFERNLATIYAQEGKETISFEDISNLNLNCNSPILVIPE